MTKAFPERSAHKGAEFAYSAGSLDRDKYHTQCHEGWDLWRQGALYPVPPWAEPRAPFPAGRVHPVSDSVWLHVFQGSKSMLSGHTLPKALFARLKAEMDTRWLAGVFLEHYLVWACPLGNTSIHPGSPPPQVPVWANTPMEVARNLKCSLLFCMTGSFLTRNFQAAHTNNSSQSTFAHPFLAMSLSQRLHWENNREPFGPAYFSKIVSEQNQTVLLNVSCKIPLWIKCETRLDQKLPLVISSSL